MTNICKRLGGKEENGVCDVGGYPTFIDTDDWYGETSVPEQIKSGDAIILNASPDDAKKFFPPNVAFKKEDPDTLFEYYYEDSIDTLMTRIKDKKPINPPFLIGCINIRNKRTGYNQTWFDGHEGRHRIEAARRAGCEKIPIILIRNERCGDGIRREDKDG